MAKIPKQTTPSSSILSALGLFRPTTKKTNLHPQLELNDTTSISSKEQKTLINKTFVTTNTNKLDYIEDNAIINQLTPQLEELIDKKIDATEFKMLAPEIGQAQTILVHSILSPNDLQGGQLTFAVDADSLSEETNTAIADVISTHFIKKLKFNTKLVEWLKEALFATGAKPVMILPETTLSSLVNKEVLYNKKRYAVAQESLSGITVDDLLYKDIYSGDAKYKAAMESVYASIDDFKLDDSELDVMATEAVINRPTKKITKLGKTITVNHRLYSPKEEKEHKTTLYKEVKSIHDRLANRFKDIVSTIKNPQALAIPDLAIAYESAIVEKNINSFFGIDENEAIYQEESVITIDEPTDTKDIKGNPLLLELPTESVLVGFIPGNPSSHVNYFIMVDEMGNPISAAPNDANATRNSFTNGLLDASFSAMFHNPAETLNIGTSSFKYTDIVSSIYENMLDKYLKKQAKSMGINNVDIQKNDDVYRCMFRRLLENKKTRMILVPASLMTYIAFDYNKNGTGKSLLEDMHFVLTMRVTLIVARMMAAIDNSINKYKISLNFDENNSHIWKMAEDIKSMFIESKLMNFEVHDPNQISKGIARRSVNMDIKGIPGLNDFSVDQEQTSNSSVTPDTDLQDDLKDMTIAGLVVPASAMNNMSEDEYSRSIATTNIVYRTNISTYQNILTTYLAKLVQTYIKYSKPLKQAIIEVIKKENEISAQEDHITIAYQDVLNNISVHLPTPNLARDKAQFEEFDQYSEMLDKILETIYSSSLLEGESDYADIFARIKAHIKVACLRRYMDISGFGQHLDMPDIDNLNFVNINKDMLQQLSNYKNANDQWKTAITKTEEDNSSSSSGW